MPKATDTSSPKPIFRTRTLRKAHRWMGLVIGVQMFFWTVSGAYFAWNPLATVRGEHLAAEAPTLSDAVADPATLASPAPALEALRSSADAATPPEFLAVDLRILLGEPVYEIRYRTGDGVHFALADASTGALRPPVDAAMAETVARADFAAAAEVLSVERVESVPRGAEYREKPLPAWRVTFDHPSGTRIYVAEETGRVTARRNDVWRAFDFLWMLHIMDFDDRDDFNHGLLKLLSLLGVITVLSGFVLFVLTSPLYLRRKGRKLAARRESPDIAASPDPN